MFSFYLFTAGSVKAATLTVSPGQSIQSVINSAAAGDTVQIRAGTYNESVSVSRSGTSSAPIKITGYPGERPIIDGQNSRSTGISIKATNVIVSNIKVTNHTGHDIDIDRSSGVTLDDLEVYITGRAVHIQNSTGVTVRNCKITTPTNLARQTDGIYSQRNKNNIYENNYIIIFNQDTSGHNDAIQMYQDDSMIARGNYLAQVNSKRGNAQGLYATTMYGTSGFYNNVVDLGDAQSNALSFLRLPQLGGTGSVEIIGNTVYGKRPFHGIWVEGVENPIVKNNLVYVPGGAALTIQNSGSGVSNNLTSSDPKFVNIAGRDFHLQNGSYAIDKGVALGAPYNTDKDGRSRPQGTAWDVGAYEFSSGGINPTQNPAGKIGDVNRDGKIDIVDIGLAIDNYARLPIPDPRADVNNDGKVDIVDIGILIDKYGT